MQRMGRATIKVDGNTLETLPGATLDIGGSMRNTVVGADRVLGYSEAPAPAELECRISLGKGITLEDLRNVTAATIQFEADTGQTYIMRNAWLAEPPKITQGDDGPVDLKFASGPAEEVS